MSNSALVVHKSYLIAWFYLRKNYVTFVLKDLSLKLLSSEIMLTWAVAHKHVDIRLQNFHCISCQN